MPDVDWPLFWIDLGIIVAWHLAVGATAPRWPDRWLDRDVGPLRLTRLDRPEHYRRLRIPLLLRLLPEAGSLFGGAAKSALPGSHRDALTRYLIEVRRGEWVHMLAALVWLALIPFNPPGMLAFWFLVVVVGNLAFILVLRYNQVRLTRLLQRLP